MLGFIKGVVGIAMLGAGAGIALLGFVVLFSGFQKPFEDAADVVIRLLVYGVVSGLVIGAGFVLLRLGIRVGFSRRETQAQGVRNAESAPQGVAHFQCPGCGAFVSASDSQCAGCSLDLIRGPQQPTTGQSVSRGIHAGLLAVAGALVLVWVWNVAEQRKILP